MRSTLHDHQHKYPGISFGRSFIGPDSQRNMPPELRRKSFEAEDGPALMRSLSTPSSSRFRLSINSPPLRSDSADSRNTPPPPTTPLGSSSSSGGGHQSFFQRRFMSVGEEDYHRSSNDSFFGGIDLPPSAPSSSSRPATPAVDVKRNHSLKVSESRAE